MAGAVEQSLTPGQTGGKARLVVAAAPRLDELAGVVAAEVAWTLPSNIDAVRVGATSVALRDEAARATRWIARLAAQRGRSATLVSPTSRSVAGRSVEAPSGKPGQWAVSGHLNVGVSRIELSPVVAAVDQPYAVGIWLPLEPRLRRLRLQFRSGIDQSLIDAAVLALPAATVLIGGDRGIAIAVIGADLLAVEVMGRALRAAAQPVGDAGLSPWEAPIVQRGIECAAGVVHPDSIRLESIWLGDPRDRGHDRLHRVVETASARAGIGRPPNDSGSSR